MLVSFFFFFYPSCLPDRLSPWPRPCGNIAIYPFDKKKMCRDVFSPKHTAQKHQLPHAPKCDYRANACKTVPDRCAGSTQTLNADTTRLRICGTPRYTSCAAFAPTPYHGLFYTRHLMPPRQSYDAFPPTMIKYPPTNLRRHADQISESKAQQNKKKTASP